MASNETTTRITIEISGTDDTQKFTRAEVDAAKAASGRPPATAAEVAELERKLAAVTPRRYDRSPDGSLHAAGPAVATNATEHVALRRPTDAFQAVIAAMDAAWRTIRDGTGRAPWQAHITAPNHAIAEMARRLVQDHEVVLSLARDAGVPEHEPMLLTTIGECIRRWRAADRASAQGFTRVHVADIAETVDGVQQAQVIDHAPGELWAFITLQPGHTFAEVKPRLAERFAEALPAGIRSHIVDMEAFAKPLDVGPEELDPSSVVDLRALVVAAGTALQRILRGLDRYPPSGLVHQLEVAATALGSDWKSSDVGRSALESSLLAKAQAIFGSSASVVSVGSGYRIRLRVNTDAPARTVVEFVPPWMKDVKPEVNE